DGVVAVGGLEREDVILVGAGTRQEREGSLWPNPTEQAGGEAILPLFWWAVFRAKFFVTLCIPFVGLEQRFHDAVGRRFVGWRCLRRRGGWIQHVRHVDQFV